QPCRPTGMPSNGTHCWVIHTRRRDWRCCATVPQSTLRIRLAQLLSMRLTRLVGRRAAEAVVAGLACGRLKNDHDDPANDREDPEQLPPTAAVRVMQTACAHRQRRKQGRKRE